MFDLRQKKTHFYPQFLRKKHAKTKKKSRVVGKKSTTGPEQIDHLPLPIKTLDYVIIK